MEALAYLLTCQLASAFNSQTGMSADDLKTLGLIIAAVVAALAWMDRRIDSRLEAKLLPIAGEIRAVRRRQERWMRGADQPLSEDDFDDDLDDPR